MFRIILFLGLLTGGFASAQELQHQSFIIDPALKRSSNAIVRNEVIEVHLEAIDEMRIVTRREVTILNEKGRRYEFASESYSKSQKIKKQTAVIYDQSGREIEKFKQKDFIDQSLVANGTLYSDDRLSYLKYTPKDYPYTLVYESEVQTENTIFLKDWIPVQGFYVSVENSRYQLFNPAKIPVRYLERNLDTLQVEKNISEFEFDYRLKNFPAFKYEDHAPDLEYFQPRVKFAPDRFSLVGVEGSGENWKDFGKWQYEHLLSGKTELPESTIEKIAQLTAKAQDDVEKAKIIYDYVQANTRYISVQLGIGGWEPMPAAEVDHLKYGDCKGLTNYTKALLESQNIPSYYAVVYGDTDRRDLDSDFPSMQGNHVILNIPTANEDVWLECTSQTLPFDYLGDFTDDRNVLLVKPEGGEIVKTKIYTAAENHRRSHSILHIEEDGSFSADFTRSSSGVPYGNIYGITSMEQNDQVLYYKKKWGNLVDVDIANIHYQNDREEKIFQEKISLKGNKLISKAGTHLVLPLHFVSPASLNVSRDRNRQLPVEIQRGRSFRDSFEYVLPAGFSVTQLPEDILIENQFGNFSVHIELIEEDNNRTLKVERRMLLKKGIWPAASYPELFEFMNNINSAGNQKVLLTQIL